MRKITLKQGERVSLDIADGVDDATLAERLRRAGGKWGASFPYVAFLSSTEGADSVVIEGRTAGKCLVRAVPIGEALKSRIVEFEVIVKDA